MTLTLVEPDPALALAWSTDDITTSVPCPECGHKVEEPLVVGCMTMVMRVFEVLGKRIVSHPRSRYTTLRPRPFEVAHTVWTPSDDHLSAALSGAWEHLDALLALYAPDVPTSSELSGALDRIVREAVAERRCVTMADVRIVLTTLIG